MLGNQTMVWLLPTPNSTAQFQNPYLPYKLKWKTEVIIQVAITVITMVVTLFGNVALIAVLMSKKERRRRRISVFLVNLAIGDLTVCFVTMTLEILFVAFGEWVLGAVLCKLAVYGQIVTLASSTFLLTAMSIDRYQVIVKPLQSLARKPKIWKKVAVAWTLAFMFATPQLFIFVQYEKKSPHPDGTSSYECGSKGYTDPWQRKVYMTFLACYVLVVPTIIMSYSYWQIIKTLWKRGLPETGEEHGKIREHGRHVTSGHTPSMRMSTRNDLVANSKRKAVKLSLSVIIAFLLCWIPYFLISLIRIYSDYKIKLTMLLSLAEKMAMIHSALNPILYGLFNIKFSRLCPCFSRLKHAECWRRLRCCFRMRCSCNTFNRIYKNCFANCYGSNSKELLGTPEHVIARNHVTADRNYNMAETDQNWKVTVTVTVTNSDVLAHSGDVMATDDVMPDQTESTPACDIHVHSSYSGADSSSLAQSKESAPLLGKEMKEYISSV
ncbi:neuropeptide S receptor-like [Lineus longissimus]|uniref:neuropeptide S receptor-like n=1 Tax=Lineus longissimus TaxID=88925 RepID=UPI00315D5695